MPTRWSFFFLFFLVGSGLFLQDSGFLLRSSFHWWQSKQQPICRTALAAGAWSFTGTLASPVFTSNFTQLAFRIFLLLSFIRTYLYPLIPWQQSLVTAFCPLSSASCSCFDSQSPPSSPSQTPSPPSETPSSASRLDGLSSTGLGGGGLAPTFTQLEGKKPSYSGCLMRLPYHQPVSRVCWTSILSPF